MIDLYLEHNYAKIIDIEINSIQSKTTNFCDVKYFCFILPHFIAANKSLSDVELLELAGEVGTHWKKLGLYLGLRACHIASLNCDHPMTEDKAFNMLIQWHEGLSKKDNARVLLSKALKKCGLVSLAESYENPKGKMWIWFFFTSFLTI